jgi:dCMP deaminase
MKEKYIKPHMETAIAWAKLSYAERKKVGAVLARDENVLSIGYNGTLPGENNSCEDIVIVKDEKGVTIGTKLVTHSGVIHAEMNCLSKMMNSHETTKDSSLFITLAPCIDCANLIVLAKIKSVFYLEEYRDMSGVKFLEQRGIPCFKVNI